jgi:hypothetical protein
MTQLRPDIVKRLEGAESKYGCGPKRSPIIVIGRPPRESEASVRKRLEIPAERRVVIL